MSELQDYITDELVPEKPDNVSEEDWLDYLVNVWCCNSLNAKGIYYQHVYWRAKGNGSIYVKPPIKALSAYHIGTLLLRAQGVISYLWQQNKKLKSKEDETN